MIIGSNSIFREELTSTNTEALLLLRKGDVPEGMVVYTDYQSAGRGQPGNTWISEKGKNLLFSIILYPCSIIAGEQFLISMTFSLGICDFLDNYTPGCRVKWPNDIYIGDDKIAGILIENSIMDNLIESTVAGIGLNLNQEKFPPSVRNPVSLKLVTGTDHDRSEALSILLGFLDKRYKQLLYGDRKSIHDEYKDRLYRLNELHDYRAGDRIIRGKITDVSTSGLITITGIGGKDHRFSFKEIDFIVKRSSSH